MLDIQLKVHKTCLFLTLGFHDKAQDFKIFNYKCWIKFRECHWLKQNGYLRKSDELYN